MNAMTDQKPRCISSMSNELTQEYLKSILHYDPDTGLFTWISSRGRRRAGAIAGWQEKGYTMIGVNGKNYPAHRLAFLYMTGAMPPHDTDHISGVRQDNRFKNLRAVTRLENQRNQKRYKTSTSGVTGVNWHKQAGKWRSRVQFKGREIYLGLFESLNEAISARKAADIKYGFHQNHGRSPL